MFRRRTPAASPAPAAEPAAPSISSATLDAAGWVLPVGISPGQGHREPAWTLIGTVGSPTATAVDPTGLVVGDGWSLDWWIGGDDRWHVPACESAVRQDLVADAPVVETRVRIPGGDAIHRAYGIRSARQTGDEWVVVEVENATPVPLAVALVLRPVMADSLGSIGQITVEPVEGGRGPDQAHLVRVDGVPAVVLPRKPVRVQAGGLTAGDVVEVVTAGEAGEAGGEVAGASCDAGMATLAVVFPVPHTAVLRVVLPVGEVDRAEAVAYPSVIPDAATVASGWEIHRRGPRFEIPERRLQVAVERSRTQLPLAHDGEAVRRDGRREPDIDPGATEVILGALDALDRPADVGLVVARWQERLADATPEVDAVALTAISRHWLLHRIDALRDWMLPEVAAAVERLDRAHRKGRLSDPLSRRRAAAALRHGAWLLAESDQADAAKAVFALSDKVGSGAAPTDPGTSATQRLEAIGQRLAGGDASAYDELQDELVAASSTGAWSGPGRNGRGIGHDLAASAALVGAARSLLVAEQPEGLSILPVFPPSWYGGAVELHDAPTAFGRLSYAIRWHGTRPAILWDFEPHQGVEAVRITVPGLDPTWSTTEVRGDALLGEVAPPAGLETITYVPDHPDIDPDMRRPGAEPEPPSKPMPESGTFS